jgi:hypothetical protein
MGWTGSGADTAGNHGAADSPGHDAAPAAVSSYATGRIPDDAPTARLPQPPQNEERQPMPSAAPAPAPDYHPQLAWSSAPPSSAAPPAPPAPSHQGPEPPGRED